MPSIDFIKKELSFWHSLGDAQKIKTLEFAADLVMLADVMKMTKIADDEIENLSNEVRSFTENLPEYQSQENRNGIACIKVRLNWYNLFNDEKYSTCQNETPDDLLNLLEEIQKNFDKSKITNKDMMFVLNYAWGYINKISCEVLHSSIENDGRLIEKMARKNQEIFLHIDRQQVDNYRDRRLSQDLSDKIKLMQQENSLEFYVGFENEFNLFSPNHASDFYKKTIAKRSTTIDYYKQEPNKHEQVLLAENERGLIEQDEWYNNILSMIQKDIQNFALKYSLSINTQELVSRMPILMPSEIISYFILFSENENERIDDVEVDHVKNKNNNFVEQKLKMIEMMQTGNTQKLHDTIANCIEFSHGPYNLENAIAKNDENMKKLDDVAKKYGLIIGERNVQISTSCKYNEEDLIKHKTIQIGDLQRLSISGATNFTNALKEAYAKFAAEPFITRHQAEIGVGVDQIKHMPKEISRSSYDEAEENNISNSSAYTRINGKFQPIRLNYVTKDGPWVAEIRQITGNPHFCAFHPQSVRPISDGALYAPTIIIEEMINSLFEHRNSIVEDALNESQTAEIDYTSQINTVPNIAPKARRIELLRQNSNSDIATL